MADVIDNPAESRFEMEIGDSLHLAAAYYRLNGDRVVLTHTIVPERFSGQGIGSELARGVFDTIRETDRQAVLLCPFMKAFYARHPEYSEIVARTVRAGDLP